MKRYGLIGYPLSHSFSRKFFLEKIKIENLSDVSYTNFPIKSINEFPDLISEVKELKGINVTSPYKKEIIKYLDEIDEDAKQIGAVNVVKIKEVNNSLFLKGYNTDTYGFTESLKKSFHKNLKSALILGTGGAANAIASGLKKMNINFTYVSRSNKNNGSVLNYSDLNKEIIQNNLLIINATPLGIFPDVNAKPDIPYEYLSNNHLLYDLIYNPAETLFLKEGLKKGTKIINGLNMLHLQAEKAWEIFNS